MKHLVCYWQVRNLLSLNTFWHCLLFHFFLYYAAFRGNSIPFPSRTQNVLIGETVELECDIQPGRARELYSIEWFRYSPTVLIMTPDSQLPPPHQSISPNSFSLSVSIEDMLQNGSNYQCVVRIKRFCPDKRPNCGSSHNSVDGARITLVIMGGELVLVA